MKWVLMSLITLGLLTGIACVSMEGLTDQAEIQKELDRVIVSIQESGEIDLTALVGLLKQLKIVPKRNWFVEIILVIVIAAATYLVTRQIRKSEWWRKVASTISSWKKRLGELLQPQKAESRGKVSRR